MVQTAWSCPMRHGRRSDQSQVLVEAWVPACAGMARKGNRRIVNMFVEANWATASFAGTTSRAAPLIGWTILFVFMIASSAHAACTGVVAGWPLRLAAAGAEEAVSITFLGHASFLIDSPGGVRIVTDYNHAIRAPAT